MTKRLTNLDPLGFYKFVATDARDEIEGALDDGAYDWYLAAGRAFDGDAERLAEGGVKELLESMASALAVEGVTLPALEETHSEHGYTLRVGADTHTLWGDGEAKRSWELTTHRTIALINGWLAAAGSHERVHVLGGAGGHDGVFVLLTPALRAAIATSGVFRDRDVPTAL